VVRYNLDIEGRIAGTYTPGSPAVMYLSNGDPGYPADPSEFEVDSVVISDIAGQKLAEPIELDTVGLNQFWDEFKGQIDQWADETAADYYDGPDDSYWDGKREDNLLEKLAEARMLK
jgi:hypothetical protein